MRHATNDQFSMAIPVVLFLDLALLGFQVEIVLNDSRGSIFLEDPRFWIDLQDLILMELVVAYRPLRLTMFSLPFLAALAIDLH